MSKNTQCIILAAGLSARFGSAKMLHQLPGGTPMLRQTVGSYLKVFASPTVVIKSGDAALRGSLDGLPVDIVECDRAEHGMSQSLISGVEANRNAIGWLIALGDMPYVSQSTVQRLNDALREDAIVVPTVESKNGKQDGNPVGFGRYFYSQLSALSGDRGGKAIVQQHPDQVIRVTVDDPGVLLDIDKPDQVLD